MIVMPASAGRRIQAGPARPLRGGSILRLTMDPAKWTGSAGGVVTPDTTHVVASDRVSGGAFSPVSTDFSTLAANHAPVMYYKFSADHGAKNLSGNWHLGVRFWIPPGQLTYWNSILVKLADADNFATKYATAQIMTSSQMNGASEGWYEAVLTKKNFTIGGGGGWDWTNAGYVYVMGVLADAPYHDAHIVVDEFEIVNALTKGLLFFTHDDALLDGYELALEAASRGVPMTLYVPKTAYGTGGIGAGGYMTLAQLQNLARNPLIEVANHSWTHDLANPWPDGWADPQVARMSEWMIRNDLARGAWTYASPGGRHPSDVLTAYLGRACSTYRLWYGGMLGGTLTGVWRNPIVRTTRSDKAAGVTTATYAAHMDDAATYGAIFCPVAHYTNGASGYFTEAEWKTILDYAAGLIAAGTHVAGTMGQLPDLVEAYRL